MYLLDLTSDYSFPLTITGYILGIVVLYFVIRLAVSDATKELREALHRQNDLLQKTNPSRGD